jgi:hypothetical protein
MKQIAYLLVTLLFITSCKSGSYEQKKPVDFDGNWISKDYLEAVEVNHSPAETAKNLFFYSTEMIISKQKGDSIEVYNGQMEMSVLPFKRSNDTLSLKLNRDGITNITYSDEDKTLYFTDKALNRIFRFVRADSTLLDKGFKPSAIAFPSVVNKATFEGIWTMFEDKSIEKVVQFDKFGNIRGWEKYENYTVVINGDLATNEDGDVVVFSKKDNSQPYGFHSKGDTLSIYKLTQNNDPDEKPVYRNGKPVALLVKIKGKS